MKTLLQNRRMSGPIALASYPKYQTCGWYPVFLRLPQSAALPQVSGGINFLFFT